MIETLVASGDEDGRSQQMVERGITAAEYWANAQDNDKDLDDSDQLGQLKIVAVETGTRGLGEFVNNRRASVAQRTGHITLHRTIPPFGPPGPENFLG